MEDVEVVETQQQNNSDLCMLSMPWRLIPQIGRRLSGEEVNTTLFQNQDKVRISDIESFNWKWSPDGRYGIDMPGGRDIIDQENNGSMSIFDMHTLSWQHYNIPNFTFVIPRVAFLYWLSCDIICAVTLVHPGENNVINNNITLTFRQAFFKICHINKTITFLEKVIHETNRSISINYWYHIFDNRSGEPFYDENRQSWLIFSNGANSLILIPYTPRPQHSQNIRYIDFDMDGMFETLLNCKLKIDPFFSAHYVPFVHKNEINFLIRVDESTCEMLSNNRWDLEGVYQLQIDLARIFDDGNTSFDAQDVKLFRRLKFSSVGQHINFTQHKKVVTFARWRRENYYGQNNNMIRSIASNRNSKCTQHSSFGTLDLETDEEKTFTHVIMPNDVLSYHPCGSLLVFRYKEEYAMRMCTIPQYGPLPLALLAVQALNNCVNIETSQRRRRVCGFHCGYRRCSKRG